MWPYVADPLHNPLCNHWCRCSKIQILGPLNVIHYVITDTGVVKSKYWAPQHNPLCHHAIVTTYNRVGQLYPNTEA